MDNKKLLEICTNFMKPISSSSSSETDDEIGERIVRQKKTNILQFVESTVSQYTLSEFKTHFRIERSTTDNLIAKYASIKQKNYNGGWPEVTYEKVVLMSLWYLANTETYREIADRFNVTLSTAHVVIQDFIDHLNRFSKDYIKWPTINEAVIIAREFAKKQGINNVIGAIDGCHIKIKKPIVHGNDYINRKGYASIILQGVTDHRKCFINISVGAPGSLHDARVLRKSGLFKFAEDQNMFYRDFFLLGDSAYPLLKWLVPPFKDTGVLTNEQIRFNFKHSSTRIIVEHAFGLLKCRFRRLHEFENVDILLITKFVVAACILHNICILDNDNGYEFTANGEGGLCADDLEEDSIEEPLPVIDRRMEILNMLSDN